MSNVKQGDTIKLRTTYNSPKGSFGVNSKHVVGEVIDIAEAQQLVDGHYAVIVAAEESALAPVKQETKKPEDKKAGVISNTINRIRGRTGNQNP